MTQRQIKSSIQKKSAASRKPIGARKEAAKLQTVDGMTLLRAMEEPHILSPGTILQLQRIFGNQGVGKLLSGMGQPKAPVQVKVNNTGPAVDLVQRTPINFKRIGNFLSFHRDKRYTILAEQTVGHLKRLTELLEKRLHQNPKEDAAIQETLEDIPEVIKHLQGKEVQKIGRGEGNWANAVLYVDGKAIANVKAQKSGIAPGAKKSKWGSVGEGKRKKEIIISHNDSEATVFNLLTPKIDKEKIKAATNKIVLDFVSTNGACEGCKERIKEFIRQKILRLKLRDGVTVRMRYRYSTPPRATYRGILTFYGWSGDVLGSDGFYTHTTVFKR